jgi:hypothetical protein
MGRKVLKLLTCACLMTLLCCKSAYADVGTCFVLRGSDAQLEGEFFQKTAQSIYDAYARSFHSSESFVSCSILWNRQGRKDRMLFNRPIWYWGRGRCEDTESPPQTLAGSKMAPPRSSARSKQVRYTAYSRDVATGRWTRR